MNLTRKQIISIGVFLLFLIGIPGIFNVITPHLFRIMPNDYIRTRLIINTLKDPSHKPDLVVFGNSRAMSGVNGYLIQEQLPAYPSTYSFTSTGQYMSESALYYTSLPLSVKTILQCIDLHTLSKPIDINISNLIALHMYGYKMDDKTASFLPALYDKLNRPDYYYNFYARDCLFSGMNVGLRNLLDDDISEMSPAKELHYATRQTSYRNHTIYKRDILNQEARDSFNDFHILHEWKKLIEDVSNYFNAKNIKYYFIIMPHNPDILPAHMEERKAALELFKAEFPFIPYIDCLNLLEAEDFYDAVHPNRKGANKLTQQIIEFL